MRHLSDEDDVSEVKGMLLRLERREVFNQIAMLQAFPLQIVYFIRSAIRIYALVNVHELFSNSYL